MGKFISGNPPELMLIPTRCLLFKLGCDVIYKSDIYGEFKTPKKFVTDLASIPRFLPLALQSGDAAPAAIIHDGRYAFQDCSKAVADKLLREAALSLGVPKWKADLFYWAVRLFGGSAWKKCVDAKRKNDSNPPKC